VAAALLSVQLLIPPVVGLANNGDFESVMGYMGLHYIVESRTDNDFSWIVTQFAIGKPGWFRSGLLTSETLLAGLARIVSEPFSSSGLFDLRVLGAIHIALLVAGIGLLVSAASALGRPAQWVTSILMVFVFTDVGYAAPLNSFFSQAASLVFLMLTLGVAAGGIVSSDKSPARVAAYFVLAALFVCSKPQESIQGPLLAMLGLWLWGVPLRNFWRRPAFWAAVGLCALSFWYYRQTPHAIAQVARYHKVFMELLKNSPDPRGDLADLGLDPAWVDNVGKIAYSPTSPFNDPGFRSAFLARFSYPKLILFYATHPSRLYSVLDRGGASALQLRHPRFGNFEKRRGLPPGAQTSSFSAWSRARRSLSGHPLIWLSFLFAVTVVAAIRTYATASEAGKRAREGIIALVAMAAAAFSVCVFANAHGDLPRHFYVFHALTDLILIADTAWIVQRLSRVRPALAHGQDARDMLSRGGA
jgi:hypothetical protein